MAGDIESRVRGEIESETTENTMLETPIPSMRPFAVDAFCTLLPNLFFAARTAEDV